MPSLSSVFLFLLVAGGIVVLLQGFGSLIGAADDHATDSGDGGHHDLGVGHAGSMLDAFNFRSVRAIATGIAFTGLGGLLALRRFDGLAALALALLLGTTLYLFVAFVMRGFTRLEADHSIQPLRAMGQAGTVSLSIPARGHGPGKVTLVVAGRRVEWPAVQAESAPSDTVIASGTAVQIVDVADDTTLTVVPLSTAS